jgi:hypothetical protein
VIRRQITTDEGVWLAVGRYLLSKTPNGDIRIVDTDTKTIQIFDEEIFAFEIEEMFNEKYGVKR